VLFLGTSLAIGLIVLIYAISWQERDACSGVLSQSKYSAPRDPNLDTVSCAPVGN
jgi:hypothetical protein